jgi:hypothetical protein
MKRNGSLYIKDILRNMQDAEEFVEGMSYENFVGDKKTFNAVVRSLEIIGEAAKNIPEMIRGKYLSIPLNEINRSSRQYGIQFSFTRGALESIANDAGHKGTGARSLRGTINKIIEPYIYDQARDGRKEIIGRLESIALKGVA